jgi:AAA15 family ATPase/GTPase
MVLPKQLYNIYTRIIPQINLVLGKIIPNLQIEIKKLNEETLNNGEIGIRCELLSLKNGLSLPLRCESDGILKIITILSALIAVYNNPNACVVIDELDSGVFEYLLGEILDIIDERCKGQLFFTSHNLRPLEVLNSKNLWFTTNNKENRYTQLKGIKKNSNARDVYLRAVQLGGQQEEVYQETDSYDIKKAFKKAGDLDV